METKYKQGDELFLVRGTALAKCVISEIIIHYIFDGSVEVKYLVRPRGQKEFLPLVEDELFEDVEEGRKKVLASLEDNYKKSVENINSYTEKMFDDIEAEYQKTLKGEENV